MSPPEESHLDDEYETDSYYDDEGKVIDKKQGSGLSLATKVAIVSLIVLVVVGLCFVAWWFLVDDNDAASPNSANVTKANTAKANASNKENASQANGTSKGNSNQDNGNENTPTFGIPGPPSEFEGTLVRCNDTGAIYFVDNGKKMHYDGEDWARANADAPNVDCSVVAAIPDGRNPEVYIVNGNNGSVTCDTYCSGDWGKEALQKDHPEWTGARSAGNNYLFNSSPGNCACLLTDNSTFAWK